MISQISIRSTSVLGWGLGLHLKPSLMTASARAVHALNLPDISLQAIMWRHGMDKPEVCWGG